jgi:DNA-binding transcriptional MocR family regulator
VRSLAADLRVSPTTVAAALAELRSRGLIVTRARSRTYVSWRPPIAGAWFGPVVPPGARDLASGNPDPSLLPDLTPFLRKIEPPRQLYGGEPVLPELREPAVAEFAEAGIVGEEIAVLSGALDGVERALQARLRPGDLVAVEDPGYAGLFDLLRAIGLALRPVPVDAKGMVPGQLADAIDEGIAAVIVNPRGQNPTGASLDKERAEDLRKVLDRAPDVMVIEDDHLGPIAGLSRLTLTAGRQSWAVVRSVAKSLGPDLRLAVMTGDVQTISRIQGRQSVGPQWVSHLLQRLVAMLWADPGVATTLQYATDTYGERRECFVAALAERGIEVETSAGITTWIPAPEEAPIVQALLEQGWAVSPGAPYRLQSERAIRVTVSTLKKSDADELATAIENAMRPTRHTRTA